MKDIGSHSIFIKIGITGMLSFIVYQLGYTIERDDFSKLILSFGTFFLIYIGIFHFTKTKKDLYFFIGLGILLRLLLVFALPNFSDDIYRFIWDGRLIIQGINPFDHLPSYYIENNISIQGIDQTLYQQLNSPHYFTIYPPVNQAIFALSTWIFPDSIWGSSLVMKSFLFAFEVGSIFLIIQLLKYFQLPAKNVLLYALNPLIIMEITGNLHFEGAMIFFLLLAIWLILIKKKWILSAIVLALSIASKLLPLMFLPLLIRRLDDDKRGWLALNYKKIISYFAIIGITLVFLFLPLLNGVFLTNFGDSLNLYFQKFEFNASLYYLFRWIGFQYKGYNIIGTLGPFLAILVLVGILLMTFLEKTPNWKNFFERLLFAICLYLLCTTTVHPWYVSLPIVLCLFTRFRFPIVWSGLIFMTYINYSYGEYSENLWMVSIEYLLVGGFMIWELKKIFTYRTPLEVSDT